MAKHSGRIALRQARAENAFMKVACENEKRLV